MFEWHSPLASNSVWQWGQKRCHASVDCPEVSTLSVAELLLYMAGAAATVATACQLYGGGLDGKTDKS